MGMKINYMVQTDEYVDVVFEYDYLNFIMGHTIKYFCARRLVIPFNEIHWVELKLDGVHLMDIFSPLELERVYQEYLKENPWQVTKKDVYL